MTRRTKRAILMVAGYAFAGVFIQAGFSGSVVVARGGGPGWPAHYLGFFLLASLTVVNLLYLVFGINIWRGNPLDPTLDPPEAGNQRTNPGDDSPKKIRTASRRKKTRKIE